jgi:uncharacterized heparinase superfamily protein
MFLKNALRNFYLKSGIYNKKISKFNFTELEYSPSINLLNCLIKYKDKKIKIEDLYLNSVWDEKKLSQKDDKNLHSFFWLFSLNLKSSKKITQSVIENWINNNNNYSYKNWKINILSKRIIAWISNSQLTYDESDEQYKDKFISIIQKQTNHLINEIENSETVDDKMIGCSAIILTGLAFNKSEKYLNFGLSLLKKIIDTSFDVENFPKSRSIRQLNFYLKYFVLIREWLKESQNDIPNYLDEIIYYLGQGYSLISKDLKKNVLFNGNNEIDSKEFNNYLNIQGYKFNNSSHDVGGYAILKDKKMCLIMDIGSSPEKKFSVDYQCGALSFEIISNQKKIICNSGYFQDKSHKLNQISRSTATQNTLVIDNHSSCIINSKNFKIDEGLKILKKKIIFEKKLWSICASHDGYNKRYGLIHERQLDFFPETNKLIGKDKLIKKKNFKSTKFEIRFHLEPNIKIMKTQDGKSILIEIENEGWKFTSIGYTIDVETGLYFGKKNSFTQNQNLFISGITNNEEQIIEWQFNRIS